VAVWGGGVRMVEGGGAERTNGILELTSGLVHSKFVYKWNAIRRE
jgi:hypothetical protein